MKPLVVLAASTLYAASCIHCATSSAGNIVGLIATCLPFVPQVFKGFSVGRSSVVPSLTFFPDLFNIFSALSTLFFFFFMSQHTDFLQSCLSPPSLLSVSPTSTPSTLHSSKFLGIFCVLPVYFGHVFRQVFEGDLEPDDHQLSVLAATQPFAPRALLGATQPILTFSPNNQSCASYVGCTCSCNMSCHVHGTEVSLTAFSWPVSSCDELISCATSSSAFCL